MFADLKSQMTADEYVYEVFCPRKSALVFVCGILRAK